jgi:hypothetical protein
VKDSEKIQRRRLRYGVGGLLIGVGTAAAMHLFFKVTLSPYVLFTSALTGVGITIYLAERFFGLPTSKDLGITRTREEMSPRDFSARHRIPRSLQIRRPKSDAPLLPDLQNRYYNDRPPSRFDS